MGTTIKTSQFDKEKLDFFLPKNFKGLDKQYMLDCIFSESIQSKWSPTVGDIMVGVTGNVWVIGGKHEIVEEGGGTLFFYGGNLCNRDGGALLNETACGTMNKAGKYYEITENNKIKDSLCHSATSDFRFVPYPHEIDRF